MLTQQSGLGSLADALRSHDQQTHGVPFLWLLA